MKVKSESEVAQLCLTLGDPMDCSLPGSSICGIFQARVLEWEKKLLPIIPHNILVNQASKRKSQKLRDIKKKDFRRCTFYIHFSLHIYLNYFLHANKIFL